jgi:hypothetical protein
MFMDVSQFHGPVTLQMKAARTVPSKRWEGITQPPGATTQQA